MEEFHDQPNGICLECWEKTEEFDKFYKSVQEAHLILLNSKYTKTEIEDDTTTKFEDVYSTNSDDVADETDTLIQNYDLNIRENNGKQV